MAGKGDIFIGMPESFGTPQRRQRRAFSSWRLPTYAGLCAVIALLLYARQLPGDLSWANVNVQRDFHDGLRECYESESQSAQREVFSSDRPNPRWNPVSGQRTPVVIQNATLFDGETTLPDFVDIIFESGVIRSIIPTSSNDSLLANTHVINAHGKHVTPGLVDMHSHHLELPFPSLAATNDVNERPLLGPITPFVRALDGFTPSDPAIRIIASGGVTTSLILPGSANIVGGQAYPIKNLPHPGAAGEPVIEDLLLENGIPESQRQRYLKMACGENPKRIYGNTRFGLAWLLREQLANAQVLQQRQSDWCRAAVEVEGSNVLTQGRRISKFIEREGKRPDSFELEPFLALLRGELNVNVHCYTPEDLERMLSVLHEFGVHPKAFHHALEAWQVPELLKGLERNITIATFAENSLYKAEAYGANLRGPKILNEHGVKVALKSDHSGEDFFAKYLLDQASVAHSFGLPSDKALQSVTSIPAHSIQQSHRIGYVRPGYDADIIIWDDHPLQVGATPVEVFIDGRPLLQNEDAPSLSEGVEIKQEAPAIRASIDTNERSNICTRIEDSSRPIIFTGIQKALMDNPSADSQATNNLVLLLENNQISCLGPKSTCLETHETTQNLTEIPLENGYITPGLIAFGNDLGIQAIPSESSTGDGVSGKSGDVLNEARTVHFAKYGVHLHGLAFDRARIGGVTKAVSPPHGSGVVRGVSVGVRTGPGATILDGGVWKEDVALHLVVGQGAKNEDTPTVGSGIEHVRQILEQGGHEGGGRSVYSRVANGSLPLVIQAFNQDDVAQLILVKREFPTINLVIYGGHGAALVAKPLAEADIPVILTGNRGAPDTWEKKDALTGPPLTESPAKILIEAGVQLGLAVRGDSKLHGLAREARWAAKYAGLTDKEAIALVSSNIERILGLQAGNENGGSEAKSYKGDFVVWEGNPLRGEGSVVASVQGDGLIVDCWPDNPTNA
ncbi:hypothetical protein BJX76DRAFT_362867 [Aspergillus varians]